MADVTIVDDKVKYIVPFICSQLSENGARNTEQHSSQPFFIGINGVQGAGKSVLVSLLKTTLESEPYNLPTVVLSLDDFYLTHADQERLAKSHADNPLVQHRGVPGTHDLRLAFDTFKSLKDNKPTKIPRYNKAAFAGQGDRSLESEWENVNVDPSKPIKLVLFEGWCVGFRAISPQRLQQKYDDAVAALHSPKQTYRGRLAYNTPKSLTLINDALMSYDALTQQLHTFVYLKATDLQNVYKWRLQQEAGLRAKKGTAMTDAQVHKFVDGYFPAYELYSDELDRGVFGPTEAAEQRRKQMTLVIDESRMVQKITVT